MSKHNGDDEKILDIITKALSVFITGAGLYLFYEIIKQWRG